MKGSAQWQCSRGVVLIAVLWLLALLTILATTVVTLSVIQRRSVERYTQAVQADDTADSAIRVLLLRLISPPDHGAAVTLGTVQSLALFGEDVLVTVQRELGRIDVNTADSDLLLALFAANGWNEGDARIMVESIVAARGEPFRSVADLRRLAGADRITPAIFDALTVFTHAPGCVESAATAAVLRALTWADAQELGGHPWLSAQGGQAHPVVGNPISVSLGGEVVRVRACLEVSGASRCRVAVVRLTGNVLKPLQVLEWQGNFVDAL